MTVHQLQGGPPTTDVTIGTPDNSDEESPGPRVGPHDSERNHDTHDTESVVLYVRGSTLAQRQEQRVMTRLNMLRDAGIFNTVDVRIIPEKVNLDSASDQRSELIRLFRTFDEWAKAHDISICPPFIAKTHSATITRDHDEIIRTPMLFLTVYRNDEIVGLYPCGTGETVISIDRYLSRFFDDDRHKLPSAVDDATRGGQTHHLSPR